MTTHDITKQFGEITETQLLIRDKFHELEAERDYWKSRCEALEGALKSEYCPCDTCVYKDDCQTCKHYNDELTHDSYIFDYDRFIIGGAP